MNDFEFYAKTPDPIFRFGDVLKGFVALSPNIDEPLTPEKNDYSIQVSMPKYIAVVSPCCSIKDQVISLAPLIKVRNAFFNNPYFAEDLTRINRLVSAENSYPPEAWENMEPEIKEEKLCDKEAYTFLEIFIYKEHEIFPEYTIHRKKVENITTQYYMIDFRHSCRVNCAKITKPENGPIKTKCLQLTIDARTDLREKIKHFYGRVPKEDIIE